MTRIEFTKKIVLLLQAMIDKGEEPVIDFVKRSDEEQKRLFDAGLSKCDGKINRSGHQSGKAMDIYFVVNGKMIDPAKGWEYWHERWSEMGGQPMISWDKGHFE